MPFWGSENVFFPKDMQRVTVISHKSHLKETIDALYGSKVLHIKEYLPKEGDYYPIGSPLENAEKISELLLILNPVKAQLDMERVKKIKTKLSLKKAESFLRKLQEDLNRINTERKEIESVLKSREKEGEIIGFLKDLGIGKFEMLKGYANLDVIGGYAQDIEVLKESVSGFDSEILHSDKRRERGYPVILFVRSGDSERVKESLQQANFSRIDLDFEWKSKEVGKEFEMFNRDMKAIEKRKAELGNEVRKITIEKGGLLLGIEDYLNENIKKSEVPLKFAVSEHSFIIQGWLPKGGHEALEARLSEITENVYFNVEECEHEEAPTQLDNKGPVRPFEFFLRLYTLPKYKEIDPSFLMFITYPIIFGVMLGDIGYGLVLFLTFAFIRFKIKKIKSLSSVLMLSALITIVAGFFFGEFFGTEHMLGYELHPLMHRGGHNMNELLILAVSIGVVHVNIGILFAFINEFRERKYRHAMGKFSWFIFQTGGILYGLTLFGIELLNPNISLAVMFAGIIGLAVGEGFMGIIEIPTLISNILSYARIAAVGLASVSLALIVNQMAEGMFHSGGVFFAMGVMLLIAGHAINTIIGLLDSFLQSLRLHYVEMFSKFYHGNGEMYKPFGT